MPFEADQEADPDQDEAITPPTCEFTSPCTTTSNTPSLTPNTRKVISHVFGRNKTSTKLFPQHVWVWYCRKHYQRARYRSTQWPFTQCDILLDSLGRMEGWGGVRWFELCLRRREVMRCFGVGFLVDGDEGGSERRGDEEEVEDGEDEGEEMSRTPSSSSDVTYHDHDSDEPISHRRPRTRSTRSSATKSNRNPKSKSKSKSKSRKPKPRRKKPTIAPCPVPDWLRQEVGTKKSFAEIRGIVYRIREDMRVQLESGGSDEIRFPDIEILPTFRGWVTGDVDDDGDDGGKGRKGRVSRVSSKGAVRKI